MYKKGFKYNITKKPITTRLESGEWERNAKYEVIKTFIFSPHPNNNKKIFSFGTITCSLWISVSFQNMF